MLCYPRKWNLGKYLINWKMITWGTKLSRIGSYRFKKMTLYTQISEDSYKHDKLRDNGYLSSQWYSCIQEETNRHKVMYTSSAWIINSFLKRVTDNKILLALPYIMYTHLFYENLKQTHKNNFWIIRKQ